MNTINELLEAAGLNPSEYSGARLAFVINKIMDDHEVLDIAARLAAENFILPALRKMDPHQLARLQKRIQPEPAPTVRWAVGTAQRSLRPLIIAKFRTEEIYFDGPPENAPLVEFHGEHPPAHILTQYARLYDPTNKPMLDASYWQARTAKAPVPKPVAFKCD